MISLLKHDFYRLFKSKLLLVTLILVIAFPIVTSLIYYGVYKNIDDVGVVAELAISTRSISSSAFSLTSNLGLVIPVFAIIILMSDISNGGLRNKVIAGHKKADIYISQTITSFTFIFISMITYFIISYFSCSLMLGFSSPDFMDELEFFLLALLLGTAGLLLPTAFLIFSSFSIKKTPISILITIGAPLFLSLLGSILQILNLKEEVFWLNFFPGVTLNSLGLLNIITPYAVVASCVSMAIVSTALLLAGYFIFAKRDIR